MPDGFDEVDGCEKQRSKWHGTRRNRPEAKGLLRSEAMQRQIAGRRRFFFSMGIAVAVVVVDGVLLSHSGSVGLLGRVARRRRQMAELE